MSVTITTEDGVDFDVVFPDGASVALLERFASALVGVVLEFGGDLGAVLGEVEVQLDA